MQATITIKQLNNCTQAILKQYSNNCKYKKLLVNLPKLQGQKLYKELATIAEFLIMSYGLSDALLQTMLKYDILDI